MQKQHRTGIFHTWNSYGAVIFALLFVLALCACTSLPKPVESVGKNSSYLDWSKNPPKARDRARHDITGPNPFEWWYFDAHLDTGETFVGTFLCPNFMNGKPGVTFSLYSPDWKEKKSVLKSMETHEMQSSAEDVDIASPYGWARRLDDKTYQAKWDMDGIAADLKFTMEAPGWMPSGADKVNEDSREFFWSVHQGRSRVEGTITKDGQTRKVQGVGYADHNWGKKKLNEITRHWVWGRIFAGDYTIIYADVDYIDASINSRPLYIAKGDKMIVGAGSPTIRQWDYVTHPVLKRHYPRQISIDFAEGGVEAHLNIEFKALVEDVDLLLATDLSAFSRWLVRTFVARPTYFRIIAKYSGTITEQGKATPLSGECLYEIMGFE